MPALSILTDIEPFAWLMVLLGFYFGGKRRTLLSRRNSIGLLEKVEEPPDYRALGVFVALRLLNSIAYLVMTNTPIAQQLGERLTLTLYAVLYWTIYLLSTISVFFVMGALLKNSLKPLPGLCSAVLIAFRWAAILALLVALTAHIPIYGVKDVQHWLNEVSVSFTICVCSFEISLMVLLVLRLDRLGMSLRSRAVGLALGLTILGMVDIVSAVTYNLGEGFQSWIAPVDELLTIASLVMWTMYVVFPEPARNAHSLPAASKLMRWNEIALQFGTAGRPAESDPFISRVEVTVATILKKHNIGNY